jgi:SHS family lactate transporter-like MFS transporter
MAILIGAVIAWMIVCVFLGPEADGAHFEQARVATVHGAGKEAPSGYVDPSRPHEEKEVKPEHVDDIEAGRTRQA